MTNQASSRLGVNVVDWPSSLKLLALCLNRKLICWMNMLGSIFSSSSHSGFKSCQGQLCLSSFWGWWNKVPVMYWGRCDQLAPSSQNHWVCAKIRKHCYSRTNFTPPSLISSMFNSCWVGSWFCILFFLIPLESLEIFRHSTGIGSARHAHTHRI